MLDIFLCDILTYKTNFVPDILVKKLLSKELCIHGQPLTLKWEKKWRILNSSVFLIADMYLLVKTGSSKVQIENRFLRNRN